MNRRWLSKFMMIFTIVFLGAIIVSDDPAHAITTIPDGNATEANGYRASPNQSGAKTHARDVHSTVERAWERNAITRGGKYPASLYHDTKGNLLIYDAYSSNWRIERIGGEDFFVFNGWSVNKGYHHHHARNQATYIGVENTKTKERKIFKTMMRSGTADRDIHFNYFGNWRRCDNNEYMVDPGDHNRRRDGKTVGCNMDYDMTRFRAYIPLNDLFKDDQGAEWAFYIIKNIDGHLVYDRLILPFSHNGLDWNNGKLKLESRENTNTLRITQDNTVIKREKARGSQDLGRFRTAYNPYTKEAQNESTGVANWYGVRDKGSGYNRIVWTSSVYWDFGGSIAILSWERTKADVTIRHIDANTDTVLETERRNGLNIGTTYTFNPKPRGTWKDKDGNPFVPIDNSKRITVRGDTTVDFHYKASIPDPTDTEEMDGATDGRAKGQFSWELHKISENRESRIDIKNNFEITGNHYAVRDISYETSSSGVFTERGNSPQHLFIDNPNSLKNKDISYKFGYEYTNHYWENYECVDRQGSDCFEWKFVNYTPAWEYAKQAEWSKVLRVDHKYGETFTFNKGDSNKLPLIISRVTTVDGGVNSMTDRVYRETFTVDRKDTKLNSQTWKEVDETVQYQSELNNDLYVISGNRYYFPNDIDDNLRSKYANETIFEFGDYAIPLRIGQLTNNKVVFLTEDNFFVTKKTGFVFSLPFHETSKNRIEVLAKDQYEDYTNKAYNDTVLTSPDEGSRYYLNIDLNGEQQPNVEYDDHVVLGKLGLNDITVQLMQTLEFDNYLFGHFKDDPVFVEQRTSIIPNVDYANTVSLTKDQIIKLKEIERNREGKIHSFRGTDDKEILDQVKGIVPLN